MSSPVLVTASSELVGGQARPPARFFPGVRDHQVQLRSAEPAVGAVVDPHRRSRRPSCPGSSPAAAATCPGSAIRDRPVAGPGAVRGHLAKRQPTVAGSHPSRRAPPRRPAPPLEEVRRHRPWHGAGAGPRTWRHTPAGRSTRIATPQRAPCRSSPGTPRRRCAGRPRATVRRRRRRGIRGARRSRQVARVIDSTQNSTDSIAISLLVALNVGPVYLHAHATREVPAHHVLLVLVAQDHDAVARAGRRRRGPA